MTAKITASADGTYGSLGVGAAPEIVKFHENGTTVLVLPNYADDAAAAAGGIPIGGMYRTGATPKCRVT